MNQAEPYIGEIRKDIQLGHKPCGLKYVWHPCPICNEPRWVQIRHGAPMPSPCRGCRDRIHGNTLRRKFLESTLATAAQKRTQKPQVGEARYGCEISDEKLPHRRYTFTRCVACRKEYWVEYYTRNRAKMRTCQRCNARQLGSMRGSKHSNWKGGKTLNKLGYTMAYLTEDNPYFAMAQKRTHKVAEHRLVMAQSLGRCLISTETVHHKNGSRSDNRLDNLLLTCNGSHLDAHSHGYRDGFEQGYQAGFRQGIEKARSSVEASQ